MGKIEVYMKKLLAFISLMSLLLLTACFLDDDYDEYGDLDSFSEKYVDDYSEDEYDDYDEEEISEEDIAKKETQTTSVDISQYFSDGAIREKQVKLKGNGEDTVTILVYMNGSNLESDNSQATTDLSEMIAAGSSDKVNIIVQTMGTKKWDSKLGIASDRSQIYKIDGNGATLLRDDLGQADCTAEKTLSDFIVWGAQNYPADRYILQFWDHGGGPVYGFGFDEWNKDENAVLTIAEMQSALKTAGVYFDFVGMDCCLMSCLEVCCAFYDYCDYMVLSEDFESGLGWDYKTWLTALYKNTSIETTELGKLICDSMVGANESEEGGDKSSMAVIDQSKLKVLFTVWKDFAYANEDKLLGTNYSRSTKRSKGGRVHPALWGFDFGNEDEEDLDMSEYFVTDIMEVASSVDSDKSAALSSAINATLCYVKNTSEDAGFTGIAVSLPYGDTEYYSKMKPIFESIGLDTDYVEWLEKFTGVAKKSNDSDHDFWDDFWEGWDQYDDDYNWDSSEYSGYDDDYWDSSYDWDDFDYNDSWNEWSEDNSWGESDNYSDYEDDWYYDDYDSDWD